MGNLHFIEIEIKKYRNISNLRLFIRRHRTTIIIGENNVGKTHVLDYIHKENEKWDKVDSEYIEGKYKSSPLWQVAEPVINYGGEIRNIVFVPSTHKEFPEKEIKGEFSCSYTIYYFDLETSIFPLIEAQGEVKFKKVRGRKCNLAYTDKSIGRFLLLNSAILSKPEETEITLWTPDYNDRDNFVKHIEDDGTEKYRGFNKVEWACHSLKTVGSGFLKHQTLKNLIEQLLEKHKGKPKWISRPAGTHMEKEIVLPFLLIDEPELLLHPSLISDMAQSIKKLEKENITTILTTHSPAFLSHFISDLFSYNEANLIILQKSKNSELKIPPLHLAELIREMKEEISKVWKNYCLCFKNEMEKNENFYYDKWKTILNEHTLKIFFSKKVLFVEGMTDYLFFTNGFLGKNIPVLNEIEVIPIFGKLNYIFFSGLTRRLGIKYRFLLDKDNNLIEENKRIEKGEIKGTKLKNCEHEPQKCTRQQVHKNFWDIHTKGRLEEKNENFIYDEEGEIDWFQQDIEYFLEIEPKDMFIVNKELTMINELEKSGLEKNKKWNERIAKLKKVLEKNF